MFHSHVNQLRTKHLDNLHGLFASHAPTLDKPFTELPVSSLVSSLPATRLGFDVRHLEDEYAKWQRERSQEARLAFDEMLSENAFVGFWGRLGKLDGKGLDETIKGDDIGEDEEGNVDMKALAKTVDLKEMVKVLRVRGTNRLSDRPTLTHAHLTQNDRRYLMFDHVPEQRERWLRVSPPLFAGDDVYVLIHVARALHRITSRVSLPPSDLFTFQRPHRHRLLLARIWPSRFPADEPPVRVIMWFGRS